MAHNSLNGFPLWKSITEPGALCLCVRLLSKSQKGYKLPPDGVYFIDRPYEYKAKPAVSSSYFTKNRFGVLYYLD